MTELKKKGLKVDRFRFDNSFEDSVFLYFCCVEGIGGKQSFPQAALLLQSNIFSSNENEEKIKAFLSLWENLIKNPGATSTPKLFAFALKRQFMHNNPEFVHAYQAGMPLVCDLIAKFYKRILNSTPFWDKKPKSRVGLSTAAGLEKAQILGKFIP